MPRRFFVDLPDAPPADIPGANSGAPSVRSDASNGQGLPTPPAAASVPGVRATATVDTGEGPFTFAPVPHSLRFGASPLVPRENRQALSYASTPRSAGVFIRSTPLAGPPSTPQLAPFCAPNLIELGACTVSVDSTALLGVGRHSRVYAGTCSDGRRVAVKFAVGGRTADAQLAAEARVLASVSSAHLPAPLGTAPGALVLDRAEETLAARVLLAGGESRREPDAAALVAWAASIFGGLAALHAAGYAHLDVKPHNVLLFDGGRRAVLADLGGAQALGEALVSAGTSAYVAPEALSLRESPTVAPAADVYAAGAVVYAMATGREPFSGAATALPEALPPRRTPGHARCQSAPEVAPRGCAPGTPGPPPGPPLEGVTLLLAVRAGFFAGGHNPWVLRPALRGNPRTDALVSLATACLSTRPDARPSAAAVASDLLRLSAQL